MSNNINSILHFIGIGGSGMTALAEISIARGYTVSGSDITPSSKTKRLKKLGATIFYSHTPENIPTSCTVIYSSAIDEQNVELLTAKKRSLQVLHRSTYLAYLMQGKFAITVAGTHGKTTTTALLFHVLKSLGRKPSVALGGDLIEFNSSSYTDSGDIFIAETDESDGSLVAYQANIGILTDIGNDHLDFFYDLPSIKSTYSQYLNQIQPDGAAVTFWDSSHCREVSLTFSGNRMAYGSTIGTNSRLLSYRPYKGQTRIEAVIEHTKISCTLPLIGKHNAMNALATLSVVHLLGEDLRAASNALSTFKGVERRCHLLYSSPQLKIYDDYAHNPGKINACIKGLKDSWPTHHIITIFEPHRYSRLKTMYNELLGSFCFSNQVFVTHIFSAGENMSDNLSPETIASDIQRLSKTSATSIDLHESHLELFMENLPETPTVLLTLGAGKINQVAKKMVELLNEEKK